VPGARIRRSILRLRLRDARSLASSLSRARALHRARARRVLNASAHHLADAPRVLPSFQILGSQSSQMGTFCSRQRKNCQGARGESSIARKRGTLDTVAGLPHTPLRASPRAARSPLCHNSDTCTDDNRNPFCARRCQRVRIQTNIPTRLRLLN